LQNTSCLLLGTISPLANITRSDNAPTTERQSQRRLSVRVALIEDEAVPRIDKTHSKMLLYRE